MLCKHQTVTQVFILQGKKLLIRSFWESSRRRIFEELNEIANVYKDTFGEDDVYAEGVGWFELQLGGIAENIEREFVKNRNTLNQYVKDAVKSLDRNLDKLTSFFDGGIKDLYKDDDELDLETFSTLSIR